MKKPGIGFEELSEENLQKIDAKLTKDALPNLHYMEGIKNRNSFGGTSPKEVKRQIEAGKEFILSMR